MGEIGFANIAAGGGLVWVVVGGGLAAGGGMIISDGKAIGKKAWGALPSAIGDGDEEGDECGTQVI